MSVALVHPAGYVDGARLVDEQVVVEAYQLTPGDVAGFVAWCDVEAHRLASGGVLLVEHGQAVGPVELGDFVVRRDGELHHEHADGFWQRYAPVEANR